MQGRPFVPKGWNVKQVKSLVRLLPHNELPIISEFVQMPLEEVKRVSKMLKRNCSL